MMKIGGCSIATVADCFCLAIGYMVIADYFATRGATISNCLSEKRPKPGSWNFVFTLLVGYLNL